MPIPTEQPTISLLPSKATRTVPIPGTLESVPGYPDKLKIYRMPASPFWQVRFFDGRKTIKRSTGATDKRIAHRFAKDLYEQILYSKFGDAKSTDRTRFGVCAAGMLETQAGRVHRGEISAQSHQNDIYMLNNRVLPFMRELDVSEVTYEVLERFVAALSDLSPSAIQRHLGIVRKTLDHAANHQLLTGIPNFPRIKKREEPRGWFTVREYRRLLSKARALRGTRQVIEAKSGKDADVRRIPFSDDLYCMISFMVSSFIRPTDLKTMQHRHVEVVRNSHTYLRLTLPESKKHNKPIVTLRKAVDVYERLKAVHRAEGLAEPTDYVFLPQFKNRATALRRLEQQFNFLLDALDLKTGLRGEKRTIYSLRHTSIMYRLLCGDGIDMLTLARNARTSIEMIERFYASELAGEMNIDVIQSQRRRKVRSDLR